MHTEASAATHLQPDGEWAEARARLADGIQTMGLAVDEARQEQMMAYLALLARWNRAYNLTAITEPLAMVDRHLLDSLSLSPWIPKGLVVDAGTGAGLPGMVLAIAGVGEQYILVDSNGKKIRFIRQACRSLGLNQVTPVQGRVESLTLEKTPQVVVARALAPLGRLVEWTRHWLDQGAVLLAMKADLQETEVDQVDASYNVSIQTLKSADPTLTRRLVLVGHAEAIERLENKQ